MVTPFQVTGQVMNSFPQALFCHIRVQGMRNDGFVVWGNASTVVYPGMTGFAYVYTSYPFQFVNGQAWADCNYGGYGIFHEDELEAASEWTE